MVCPFAPGAYRLSLIAYPWERRVRRILLRLEDKLVLAGGGERRAGNARQRLPFSAACWDLDRVAQGNSAPHARIHYACLREVRAAQANVADIGFRFQVQYAKSNLRALGTRFQVAVFLERSCGIDHHLISLQFEHSITLIFIQPCRVN